MKPSLKEDKQTVKEEDVIRASQRDPSAFRPLYEKYYRSIFRFVLHRVADKEVTADLTSQVFLKALLHLDKFQLRGFPFSSWLYRIAINECNDFFRKTKKARAVVLEEGIIESLHDEMFGNDEMDEWQRRLPFILEKLKPEELQLIELRYMESRPFKEVADILGISENYAKVRTYRVLDKMKKLFLQQR